MPHKNEDYFHEWMQLATAPRKALLIDDNKHECEVIVRNSSGFNVTWEVCYTGSHALEKLDAACASYSLAVMDLRLNDVPEGVQLFREIKKRCPNLPVVILSGFITNDVIMEITRIGFAMFAQKPSAFDSQFFQQLFQILGIPKVRPGLEQNIVGNI